LSYGTCFLLAQLSDSLADAISFPPFLDYPDCSELYGALDFDITRQAACLIVFIQRINHLHSADPGYGAAQEIFTELFPHSYPILIPASRR